ncbi:hypothetical protein TWF694_002032 [Orbilia ellipsospora]|uniref:Mus7/MMS22 family-domain-containing protein n=1 Tax=Orbilia ellipsospora TaxID=2528407 RepID=A0AAV9X4D7_9PEZI
MTDWRALGYVPDSEDDSNDDLLLSPPISSAKSSNVTTAGAQAEGRDVANDRKAPLDLYDFPSSSADTSDISSSSRKRGRGRPPKRGRGVTKRSSLGGNERLKQPTIEEPDELAEILRSDKTSASMPSLIRGGVFAQATSSPSFNRISSQLASRGDDGQTTRSDSLSYSLSLGKEATSPIRFDTSNTDGQIADLSDPNKAVGEIETIDLVDQHGPDSEPEDPAQEQPIPPSSPPFISRLLPVEPGADSPAPPTPVSIRSLLEVRILPSPHTGLTDPVNRTALSSTVDSDGPQITADDFTSGVVRNLRERKPIQMNPYLLEEQQYKSVWKSRGLRPVKYAQNEPILPSNKKQLEKDSQDEFIALEEDEETQLAPAQATQSFQSLGEAESFETMGSSQDDNLPSLDELFRQSHKERPSSPGARTTAQGSKRQKTKHRLDLNARMRKTITAANSPLPRRPATAGESDIQQQPNTPITMAKKRHDIFDLSSSDSELLTHRTPVSTMRRRIISDSSGSETEGTTTPRPRTRAPSAQSRSEESSESLETDPERREREIHKLQRKVRGVLPASYLRLNQPGTQDQVNKRGVAAHNSPERRPMVKGMAQMRIRTGAAQPAGSLSNPLNLSSGDSSDDDDGNAPPPVDLSSRSLSLISPRRVPQSSSISTARSARSYAFEDNAVDRMLGRPTGPRSYSNKPRGSKSKAKFTQSRLSNGSFATHTSGSSRHRAGHSKLRPKPAPLSVVDACMVYRDATKSKPPQFMRIVERRMNKRRDAGRHLPHRKVIKIDRVYDNETDEEETLARWKRAKLSYSSSLAPISGNSISINNNNKPQYTGSKPLISSSSQPRYLQTRLSPSAKNSLPRQPKMKPKVKYKAVPKPIAILPGTGQLRMEQIIRNLRQKRQEIAVDPIDVDSPPLDTQLTPTVEASLNQRGQPSTVWVNKPSEQYFVNSRSEVFNQNGKVIPTPKRGLRRKKPEVPKRIDRNKSPIAFKPPEKAIPRAAEFMEIDSSNENILSFEKMPPRGTYFSRDFDIKVPKSRDLFHESTFIGSGCLFKALATSAGKLSPSSRATVSVQEFSGQQFDWGVYDESVVSQLESYLTVLLEKVERCLNEGTTDADRTEILLEMRSFFRYLVEYLSSFIYFSDLIDISSFVARFSDIISDTLQKASSLNLVFETSPDQFSSLFKLEIYSYAAIVSYQLSCIVGDLEISTKSSFKDLQLESLEGLISLLMALGSIKLQESFSKSSQNVLSHGKLDENLIYLESWIIAYHTSPSFTYGKAGQQTLFWENVNTAISSNTLANLKNIEIFENTWRVIFRLLPLSVTNSRGEISPPEEADSLPDNWKFVKDVVGQSLQIYNLSDSKGQRTANGYLKALFDRCLILTRDWKWRISETIMPTLYEFFAKRGLQNLKDEDDRGSPKFLQELSDPKFDSDPTETCFSTFLKIVALGLERLRTGQDKKTIEGLIVRITPNHGRTFPKEEALDLNEFFTLRNHHDLLTAIYYGSRKPRIINIVRPLVDPEKSHSNVCSLSLRTWSKIVTFELADPEKNPKVLSELMTWYSNIILTTVKLHKELKVQAEQARLAEFDPRKIDDINKNTRTNQRSLESVLSLGLGLLDTAFKNPHCDFYSAQTLLAADSMKAIFGISHSLDPRLVADAVKIISSHVKVCREFGFSSIQDDSQMSWAGFDNVESDEIRREAGKKILDEIYDPLFDLINSYFAEESKHLDQVLVPCIQVWIELASLLVQCELKTWDDYFNAYRKSWFSMVDTENKKTYSVYYVANIMQIDPSVYEAHKAHILQVWISSLVERDSLLKFQHELTSIIFNYDLSNMLFSHMPFIPDPEEEKYVISLKEFRQRRLSLISTLLENMQNEIPRLQALGDHRKAADTRTEYMRLLQDMMNAMKRNYIEIQSHQPTKAPATTISTVSREKSASAYVTFCQQVVELLQQYATELGGVDRFFIDSVTFPLPTNDPTYVTSKLKGYNVKSQSGKKGWFMQLSQFFQNTCSRVAIEGQQDYFVAQMLAAFEGDEEKCEKVELWSERAALEVGKKTLKEVLVFTVFGCYIGRSMEGLANLVLAVPIAKAAERVMGGLVRELDGLEDGRKMDSHVSNFLVVVLKAVIKAVDSCIGNRNVILNEPLALYVLDLLARLTFECNHLVNLLHPRVDHVSEGLAQDLLKIAIRGLSRLKACLMGTYELPEELDMIMFQADLSFESERAKYEQEYKADLRNWKMGDGRELKLQKGGSTKVIQWRHLVQNESVEEGKRVLLDRVNRVLELASLGICEGVVKDVDLEIWDKARRPMLRMVDFLFQEGGQVFDSAKETAGSSLLEENLFDMDD